MSIDAGSGPVGGGELSRTVVGGETGLGRARLASRRTGPRELLLGLLGLLVLLSLVRLISGVDDLTSAGVMGATLSLSVPVGLAGLGGLWSERAGVVNIGLEGMMILGTWGGAFTAWKSGSPWVGLLGGLAFGALGGLLHAVATVSFGVDQIVSGVAITILAGGAARYLSGQLFTGESGGGPTQSPPVPGFSSISVPGADYLLRGLESRHWFLLSDVAGILRGVTTQLTWLTVIAVLLVPASYLVLWRTAFGLRLRSCGENPVAAESLGIDVYRLKYAGVVISGALAGMAGVFLVTVSSSIYREGQTGGRGYIGLAAMIFGNWRPGGLAAGAGLFGYTDAVQLRGGPVAVHGLLLFVTILLLLAVLLNAYRRRQVGAVVALVAAAAFFAWYQLSDEVPQQLVFFTPHLTTLLVLSLASQRLRMPAADGVTYRKGQGG
ncbi:nucleoside ABC transporter membrane protein [Motilibacter rhizosphaerae]|uniref:Nucleoside ABC transporter membrane protein n=1 Tax=Motilibacter rhizosphaerae TaxID=598652 RepID=A0A4Q7NTW6_9ACTN|nr:ABC transporter permease [Motilibacter rhizosphaerae]RZS90268.1 nucleoside ABC transporter membrane protein [Motilibacter rhizosphaerae]